MTEIRWKCDSCGEELIADGVAAGAEIDCPQCGKRVTVPEATPAKVTVARAASDTEAKEGKGRAEKEARGINKTAILIVALVILGALLGYYVFSEMKKREADTRRYEAEAKRYEIIESPHEGGIALRVDRKTGKTWIITAEGEQRLIEVMEETYAKQSPEERAIQLVKDEGLVTDEKIRNWLKQQKGFLRVRGWHAERIDDMTYFVSYTYNKGGLDQGWFYEVHLAAELVRDIVGDPVLEEKYGLADRGIEDDNE